jgi:hypothetical protein
MQELSNISAPQFYYSKLEEVIESCSHKENCVIIKNDLLTFGNKRIPIVALYESQIIGIRKSVNKVHAKLEVASVLLLAAASLNRAVKIPF